MRSLKFINTTSLTIAIATCGAIGSAEAEIRAIEEIIQHQEEINSQRSAIPALPYFESQTDANCAIHAINMALGERFISTEYYDKYTMFIGAKSLINKENPNQGYITENQYHALVHFLNPENNLEDFNEKIKQLELNFNSAASNLPNKIELEDYLNQTGVLGRKKAIENVIIVINKIYNLNLPINLNKFNDDNLARLAWDFENIASIVVYTDDHFFVLRKYENNWYQLDSLLQGPQILLNDNPVNWLEEFTLNHDETHIIYFTSAQIEAAKNALHTKSPHLSNEIPFHLPKSVFDSLPPMLSPEPSEATFNEQEIWYFPHYDKADYKNIATEVVHMALGTELITPDDYERYLNLIAIKNNPHVSGRQRRLMRKYYDGGESTGEFYTREKLEEAWDLAAYNDALLYKEYLHQTGVFDQDKNIYNVINTINDLYDLKVPNEFNIEANANVANAERMIVDLDGSFVVLRRDLNDKWWLLDILAQNPKLLAEGPKNWLQKTAQFFPNIKLLCFTVDDILKLENPTKNLPAPFADSMTKSDPFGRDFVEEFFYLPSLSPLELQYISEELFSEQPAFQDNTYKFLHEFTLKLFRQGGGDRSKILETFNAFIEQIPVSNSTSSSTSTSERKYKEEINPDTIKAFREAAAKWGLVQTDQPPH
ncbi:MAG: Josephin [Glomeribacter sp. 1016415]|nr:Josephin [Glomeribacter sp. 1016415]